MTYPRPQEYSEALQFPQLSVLDPLLAKGSVQNDAMGLPFGRTGQFALTFKITAKGRPYAYRCFLQERTTIHERYDAVSTFLSGSKNQHFVGFTYLDSGIRVAGRTYPVVRMDWADGQPLGLFIQDNHTDRSAMESLRARLRVLSASLADSGIAHGDIQSGNILVNAAGELTLVDYDGVYIPSIARLGAIETGHANFQHPGRSKERPFDARVDAFSFALLDTALGALIEKPALWDSLKGDPDRILLGAQDLANPASSAAFAALAGLSNAGAAAQDLRAIAGAPYGAVPSFEDFLHRRNIPAGVTGTSTSSKQSASGDIPWYRDEPAAGGVGSPPTGDDHSGLRIVSASRPTTWPTAGTTVELVGIVRRVEQSGSAGLPSTHLVLRGGQNPVNVDVWAEGIRALARSGTTIDQSWAGSWVSVTGVWKTEYKQLEGARHSINVASPAQIQHLSETQGRLRVERAGQASQAQQGASTGTAQQGNADKVSSLSGSATKAQASSPPASQSASSGGAGQHFDNSFMGLSGASWRWIATIVLGALLLGLLLAGVIAAQSSDGGSSGNDAVAASTAAAAPDANDQDGGDPPPVVEFRPASDAQPECYDRNFAQTSCRFASATHYVGSWDGYCTESGFQVTAAGRGQPLCLEPLETSTTYLTCVEGTGFPKECYPDLFWQYWTCDVAPEDVSVRQRIKGEWQVIEPSKTTWDCAAGVSGTKISRKVSNTALKTYEIQIAGAGTRTLRARATELR